jgi:hypothetical protein
VPPSLPHGKNQGKKSQNRSFHSGYFFFIQVLTDNSRHTQQGITLPCQAPLQGNSWEIRRGCDCCRFHWRRRLRFDLGIGISRTGQPITDFDPKRTVGLIDSLSASGLESGSPDTAITFQALLVERHMARALSIFVMHR